MSSNRSFVSSLSMDGSVTNLIGNSFQLIGLPQPFDPNSQHLRRGCLVKGEDGSVKCGSNAKCHCSKKRKLRIKRSIKVPAISNKAEDIPPDEYLWRKYGQKPIKGSPHPRNSFKRTTYQTIALAQANAVIKRIDLLCEVKKCLLCYGFRFFDGAILIFGDTLVGSWPLELSEDGLYDSVQFLQECSFCRRHVLEVCCSLDCHPLPATTTLSIGLHEKPQVPNSAIHEMTT